MKKGHELKSISVRELGGLLLDFSLGSWIVVLSIFPVVFAMGFAAGSRNSLGPDGLVSTARRLTAISAESVEEGPMSPHTNPEVNTLLQLVEDKVSTRSSQRTAKVQRIITEPFSSAVDAFRLIVKSGFGDNLEGFAFRLSSGAEPLLTLLPTETHKDSLVIQVPQSQQGEYLILVLRAEVEPSFQDTDKDLFFNLNVR